MYYMVRKPSKIGDAHESPKLVDKVVLENGK
jgi:hypothetical protein